MNTNIIRSANSDRIRTLIRIIPNMNTKTMKKLPKLRTEKIACWVFCALITTETLKSRLWVKFLLFGFQTSTEYEYE